MKKILGDPAKLKPFDISLPCKFISDASKLYGLGFILTQINPDGSRNIVACGSTSLTKAQLNYSVIELELLAAQWGVSKCSYYLKGCPGFVIETDHLPLIGLEKKTVDDIDNPRVLKIRERLAAYSYKFEYIPG